MYVVAQNSIVQVYLAGLFQWLSTLPTSLVQSLREVDQVSLKGRFSILTAKMPLPLSVGRSRISCACPSLSF